VGEVRNEFVNYRRKTGKDHIEILGAAKRIAEYIR
jgi:hypothetical protein